MEQNKPHAQPQQQQLQRIVGVKQVLTLPQPSLYDAHCNVLREKLKYTNHIDVKHFKSKQNSLMDHLIRPGIRCTQ
jgi:hypothetical protein